MGHRRLVAFIFAALGVLVGNESVLAQAGEKDLDQASTISNLSSPASLGICGPVHETIFRLGPRTDDGSFDADSISFEQEPSGSFSIYLPGPTDFDTHIEGIAVHAIRILEHRGLVQAAILYWEGTPEEKDLIANTLVEYFSESKGSPQSEDGIHSWNEGDFRFGVWRGEPEMWNMLFVSCLPTRDEYDAAIKAAEAEAEEPTETVTSADEPNTPNPWLDRHIVGVIARDGQPIDEPKVIDGNVVGLHFADKFGPDGQPMEFWWWFLDGKAVYVAGEFLLPSGVERAMNSFNTFRSIMEETFGPPTAEGFDEKLGAHRLDFANGSQRSILTLLDPDGDPWFRLEIFDTNHMEKLGTDLRPGRRLPKRFKPEPPESGIDRWDVAAQSAAG